MPDGRQIAQSGDKVERSAQSASPRAQAVNPVERKYKRLAPIYDWLDAGFEKRWKAALRPLLFDGVSGRVLDAGAGTGLNIPFYPDSADVTAVDISTEMLSHAQRRARQSGQKVKFMTMDATRLSLATHSFDHVVGAFLFCNLPRDMQRPALAELARVVRPGGTIRLLDYRLADRWFDRMFMRIRAPWLKLVFGARFDPETEKHVDAAGLVVREYRAVADGRARLLILDRP